MTKKVQEQALFLEELAQYDFVMSAMDEDLAKLDALRIDLSKALGAALPLPPSLKAGGPLAGQVETLRASAHQAMRNWSERWDSRAPARVLSESFSNKAILLVFGKVNAGKSSFCNFLAGAFAGNGRRIARFYLQNNTLHPTTAAFDGGVTETTARIQGVEIGENLILLDTPGLHSVTPENGEITKRFTDSADAILWLSSSGSPGQVQELDELRDELQSGKPLLPVITKSDVEEEDEVDGEIIKILRNKTSENRAQQEEDVRKRAEKKLAAARLNEALLRPPISISVSAANKAASRAAALEQAGFERLFGELRILIRRARIYKQSKAARLMMNHMEENVLGVLETSISPQISHCREAAEAARRKLKKEVKASSAAILNHMLIQLPVLLERHKETRDLQALHRDLDALCATMVKTHLQSLMQGYVAHMDNAMLRLSHAQNVDFEELTLRVDKILPDEERAENTRAGALLGGAAGLFFGGPAGALAGAMVGGWFGRGGLRSVQIESEDVSIGVDYQRLQKALEQDLRRDLPPQVEAMAMEYDDALGLVVGEAQRMESILTEAQKKLRTLKTEIQRQYKETA